jgi:hypothetical protein
MRRLGDLVERGLIAREHDAPLRELAARHVSSTDAGRVDDSLRILALLGAPAELLDRVLALALDDDLGASEARPSSSRGPDRAIQGSSIQRWRSRLPSATGRDSDTRHGSR